MATKHLHPGALPNLNGAGKRAALERALKLWYERGAFWQVGIDPDRAGRYRVVTGNGTLWEGLTVKEGLLLCHGAASAWQVRDRDTVSQTG